MHTLLTSTWKEANLLVRVATILPHPYIPSESTHLLLSFLSICAYPPLPPKLVLNPATVIFKLLSSNVERSLFSRRSWMLPTFLPIPYLRVSHYSYACPEACNHLTILFPPTIRRQYASECRSNSWECIAREFCAYGSCLLGFLTTQTISFSLPTCKWCLQNWPMNGLYYPMCETRLVWLLKTHWRPVYVNILPSRCPASVDLRFFLLFRRVHGRATTRIDGWRLILLWGTRSSRNPLPL